MSDIKQYFWLNLLATLKKEPEFWRKRKKLWSVQANSKDIHDL